MGPQARHSGLEAGSVISLRPDIKERLMSGSGSPGRLGPDNVSRDSGIGCLKVSIFMVRHTERACLECVEMAKVRNSEN